MIARWRCDGCGAVAVAVGVLSLPIVGLRGARLDARCTCGVWVGFRLSDGPALGAARRRHAARRAVRSLPLFAGVR